MTKDVLISVKGLQFGNDVNNDMIEIITGGSYYKKNQKHYVLYDEMVEGFEGATRNIVKFDDTMLDLTKSGVTNVHMVFEENKKNLTNYITPYGNILIGIDARKVNVAETKESIQIDIDYGLEVNYEFLADCKIKMDIKSKDDSEFSLH
ncbi:MAG TPA: DUF1934 domain-containing protein [Lachnospiraceae bacterium]|nr:DUF1934 domain-containing protein [Lachnospiraceae bacterium]